jgi:hypothetical protein
VTKWEHGGHRLFNYENPVALMFNRVTAELEKIIMAEPTINAYGLKTRVWTYYNKIGYGCSECCNGDRCDQDCTAKYKGRRNECPHCQGKGWIPLADVTNESNEVLAWFSDGLVK